MTIEEEEGVKVKEVIRDGTDDTEPTDDYCKVCRTGSVIDSNTATDHLHTQTQTQTQTHNCHQQLISS